MKTTGMIRRVDSLGRIVIPKEIRKVLKIKENEQVEINVEGEEIILNRYSELESLDESLKKLIDTISDIYKIDILITNLNNFNVTTKNYIYLENKELSPYLANILNDRQNIVEKNKINISLNSNEKDIESSYLIRNIIINGDVIGLIIILSDNIENVDFNIVELINKYLIKELE